MSLVDDRLAVDVFTDRGTGSHEELVDYEIVECQIGHYTIKLKLTAEGQFVDILEVKLSKDFTTYKQKMASSESWDVSDYYDEE